MKRLDLIRDVLDTQVTDREETKMGRVDGLVLELREGQPPRVVSIEMEVPGRANLRLRTTTAGTVIGEIALVQDGRRTATAIAESPCRVVGVDRAALARMEQERPDLALTFQRFLILELAGKVSDTNRLLEAELQ